MEMKQFIDLCREKVIADSNFGTSGNNNVFVVWSCKTLQNCKALLANDIPNDLTYYEFTYNGDKHETYMDKYTKVSNQVIK